MSQRSRARWAATSGISVAELALGLPTLLLDLVDELQAPLGLLPCPFDGAAVRVLQCRPLGGPSSSTGRS